LIASATRSEFVSVVPGFLTALDVDDVGIRRNADIFSRREDSTGRIGARRPAITGRDPSDVRRMRSWTAAMAEGRAAGQVTVYVCPIVLDAVSIWPGDFSAPVVKGLVPDRKDSGVLVVLDILELPVNSSSIDNSHHHIEASEADPARRRRRYAAVGKTCELLPGGARAGLVIRRAPRDAT
jgi:hypothetical protein